MIPFPAVGACRDTGDSARAPMGAKPTFAFHLAACGYLYCVNFRNAVPNWLSARYLYNSLRSQWGYSQSGKQCRMILGLGRPLFVQPRLHTALRLARQTGAKSLELRAALNLCRLQRKHGCREERGALAAVAEFFTEGFDTKDLNEAQTLLASSEIP